MNFILGSAAPENENKPYYIFLFQQNNLLVKKLDKAFTLLTSNDLPYLEDYLVNKFYIGCLNDYPCYAARFSEGEVIPDNMQFVGLRQLFENIDKIMLQVAFRAIQIVTWDETHRFCGICGEATVKMPYEHAKLCPNCSNTFYPCLSPAIIVAITKDNKLLLAGNKNSTTGLLSVLAGFVEAGETLEECVKREIREEVGIEVNNIKYFGSQSWPFPNSFMIAFTAEHASGEIKIDDKEISNAGWFTADEILNITNLPKRLSISRRLIDWFIEKYIE